MQYKNRKNLYKIVFITILLGFTISLVGCNWLSLGLLNIFDPQAQIRIKNFYYTDDFKNIVTFEVFTINQVEFIGSSFELEYYRGSTKLDSLKSSIGINYYVSPSSAPGVEGPATKITELCLYTSAVLDYVKTYSAFNEISCDLYIVGTDGAGHNLKVKVASGISALGVDNEAPKAVISAEPMSGYSPLTVIFDGSDSTDNGIGIAQYEWDYGDGTTATGVMPAAHTYTESGTYIVMLTVTDYFGNMGIAMETINVEEAGAPTAVINVTPSTTGIAPFTVYFDASDSSVESDCGTCSIVSYSWDFGDTETGTGLTTSHEYTVPGTYIVVLTVTDSNGNTGYDSVTITVNAAGVPSTITMQANPTTVTAGGGTSLITATVKDAGGNPVTDGTTVTFSATLGILTFETVVTVSGIATTTLTLTNSGTETISSTVGATSGVASANVVVYCPPPTP